MVLGHHFAHKIYFVHKLHPIPSIFVLATKQTLLSIKILVNHALLRLVPDWQFTGPEDCTLDTFR